FAQVVQFSAASVCKCTLCIHSVDMKKLILMLGLVVPGMALNGCDNTPTQTVHTLLPINGRWVEAVSMQGNQGSCTYKWEDGTTTTITFNAWRKNDQVLYMFYGPDGHQWKYETTVSADQGLTNAFVNMTQIK